MNELKNKIYTIESEAVPMNVKAVHVEHLVFPFQLSGSEDNKNWNALEPEIKCSLPVLTDPNWHLAKTSLQFRTDFCAC